MLRTFELLTLLRFASIKVELLTWEKTSVFCRNRDWTGKFRSVSHQTNSTGMIPSWVFSHLAP